MNSEAAQGKVVPMAPPINDEEVAGSSFPYLIGELLNALIEAEGTGILTEFIEDAPNKWTSITEFIAELQRAIVRLDGEKEGKERIEQLALQLAFELANVLNQFEPNEVSHHLPAFKVFLEMSQGQTWMVIKPSALAVDHQSVENAIRAQKDLHPYDTPVDETQDQGLLVFALNYRTRSLHLYDSTKFRLDNLQFFSN